MVVSSLRAILVLVIVMLAPSLLIAQNSAAASPNTAKSPQLQRATLPNGFAYVVAANARGTGRISLRLVVHVGSLDEHDDERGYAHFVEHMAFNGTTHFAPGKLVPFFERLGLAYGPDTNAETSYAHTVYRLDFPSTQSAHLAEGFQAMRDFADGITFGPAEVQRERGVILSEISARNNDDYQTEQQRLRFLYAGTLLPDRSPLGDPDQIKSARPETLRAFYQRCYSAERMTLIIAGDVNSDTASELVTKTFSSLRGGTEHATVRAPIVPHTGGLQSHIIHSPKMPAANVVVMTVATLQLDTLEAREANLADMMMIQILNRRLAERRAKAGHFGGANAFHHYVPDLALIDFRLWFEQPQPTGRQRSRLPKRNFGEPARMAFRLLKSAKRSRGCSPTCGLTSTALKVNCQVNRQIGSSVHCSQARLLFRPNRVSTKPNDLCRDSPRRW